MPSALILTNTGLAKLASATPEQQLTITHIAVGDGGGGYPPIDPDRTALVNEVWRGPASQPIRDSVTNRALIFEGLIPADIGGFSIREIGIFDGENDLIAIGQVELIEKPGSSPGSSPITLTLRVRILLENAAQTDLIISDAPYIDHQALAGRGSEDAHPMSAITGLVEELDNRPSESDFEGPPPVTGQIQKTYKIPGGPTVVYGQAVIQPGVQNVDVYIPDMGNTSYNINLSLFSTTPGGVSALPVSSNIFRIRRNTTEAGSSSPVFYTIHSW